MKLPQFIRFILVGLTSTATHFLVLTLLYKGFGCGIILATIVAFSCSLLVSYLVNRSFTFHSKVDHHYGAPRFVLVTLAGLLWNVTIMFGMVEVLELNYYLAFLCMSVVVALNNYLLSRKWVFKDSTL